MNKAILLLLSAALIQDGTHLGVNAIQLDQKGKTHNNNANLNGKHHKDHKS